MFKLPLLQPSLTGANGVERKDSQSVMAPFATGARSGKESDLAAAVAAAQTATFDVRSWSRQARDITSDLAASDKYKSLALHAEVKLAEALERCERVSPLAHTPAGEERPNKLRTAVACQLLGEFAELCGPFAGVLTRLRDELLKGLYSTQYASERGGLAFDQLPWFSVAERLERDKQAMVEERDAVKGQMEAQAEALGRIEEAMSALRRATEASQLEAAALRSHLERLSVSEESARLEAKTGREELKKLRKEYLRMRDDLEAERAAHAGLQRRHADLNDFSVSRIAELEAVAEGAFREAEEARRLAESRMPPEMFEKLKSDLALYQTELAAAQANNKDLEAVNSKLAHRLDVMTPRPVWRKLADHNLQAGRRTAELVHRVEDKLGRYANELAELKSQLALAAALLQPDPAPVEVQLTLVTDASSYFVTEGGGDTAAAAGAPAPPATAEPCGLAASVPRCLRWPHRVPLHAWSVEQAEALVGAIWRAKQALEVSASAGTLQSFLYYYFNPQGLANESSVRLAYSLYNACATHARSNSLVRTFWLVLTGQAAEAAAADQRSMLSGLAAVLHSLPPADGGVGGGGAGGGGEGGEGGGGETSGGGAAGDGEDAGAGGSGGDGDDERPATSGSGGGGGAAAAAAGSVPSSSPRVRTEDVAAALERFFPQRPAFRLNKLRDALRTQFPLDTLPLDALVAALEPHALAAPPPSTAPGTAKAARWSAAADPTAATAAAAKPAGALVAALVGQHIDEVQALCLEVASALAEVPMAEDDGGSGAASPVELPAVVEKLSGLLGARRAMACVMASLGFSAAAGGEGGGGGGVGAAATEDGEEGGAGAGGASGGSGLVVPVGVVVDVGDMTQRLLQRCLLKPVGNFDVAGALAWAREMAAAA
ncbi:hypothetical protein CHLRE_14g627650v5 [Chlamydomonas reinhardtii]|uniref:Translin-associated factor X-interacting protein 1 N-terminal domain-containing protein n=1 Tax=Chlamydomonas reinhardtii TaxID=3055 RepID=A0A2K3CYI2_CHLRE|nr:uncharacterized protein CHLRE_14g627650v5 [Chlamydomonas reinhardtii]PNW73319.1 hypothetical protein CHLRE_14g627650v5 [Chlamydomonas reinhardtii]